MKYFYTSIAIILSLISIIYMDENLIRKIAREEAQKMFEGNFDSGNVGPHQHDGADNLKINPRNIGFYQVPNGVGKTNFPYTSTSNGVTYSDTSSPAYGFASPNILSPATSGHLQQYVPNDSAPIATIPIVAGNGVGIQGSFNGGAAPDGTMVAFITGSNTTSFLYVRFGGQWYGVNLSATVVSP